MGEKQGHTPGRLSANKRDREAILDAAAEHPGSSPVWIARKIGVSKGQAYYHMTKAGCGDVMARIGRRIAVVDALPHHQKAAA